MDCNRLNNHQLFPNLANNFLSFVSNSASWSVIPWAHQYKDCYLSKTFYFSYIFSIFNTDYKIICFLSFLTIFLLITSLLTSSFFSRCRNKQISWILWPNRSIHGFQYIRNVHRYPHCRLLCFPPTLNEQSSSLQSKKNSNGDDEHVLEQPIDNDQVCICSFFILFLFAMWCFFY